MTLIAWLQPLTWDGSRPQRAASAGPGRVELAENPFDTHLTPGYTSTG